MTLKKNDKIIAVVGVVILIIAAIGIFLYVDMDDTTDDPSDNGEIMTYEVTRSEEFKYIEPDNTDFVAKDKILRDQPYMGTITGSVKHLSMIEIFIDYEDDIYGFLGGRLLQSSGQDTLTVTVMGENDEVIETKQIQSMKNDTITIPSISTKLPVEPIEAKSFEEAQEEFNDMYYNVEEKSFTYKIKVEVSNGESVLRLFAWLREKLFGSDVFDMEVKYYYYDYVLEEAIEDDNDDDMEPSSYSDYKSTPYYFAALNAI